jgi:SpoVK/Ycf46/Vps4 family AAA+-type ATPase
MTDRDNLLTLIRSETPCIAISTYEEGYALGLVRDCVLDLNMPMWLWDADSGISDGHLADASPVQNTTNAAAALTYWKLRHEPGLLVTLDLIGYLGDERTLRCLRDLLDALPSQKATLVMVDYRTTLPEVIAAYATPFTIACPDEAELESIVRGALTEANREHPIVFSLKRSDFDTLIKNLRGLSRRHVRRIVHDIVSEDWRLSVESIHRAIAEKRRALNADGLLEFIETPADLCAIGGLKRLKSWLAARFAGMTTKGQKSGLPAPRGVLLLGVQGAGKSLCAKAIATAWQRPLLRLDPCALYDRYVGESERRLRDALDQAEAMAPIILWVDEIEKGFASAAGRSTDGGLSQRMFGTLLTWMQDHTEPVFIVATANDIEALPPELLRKGRFDEIFFVDLPGPESRREIFSIHLKKRGKDPAAFDLDALAKASDGYSGAEIEQAVVSGLYDAFVAGQDLSTQFVLDALRNSPPLSVTMAERVEALREWAKGRCVPAE